MNHCRDMHQGINFSEFKSYHQNGISDFFMRSLQDLERCKIIHAHHQYPSAVTENLWPYIVRNVYNITNETP